MFLFYCLFVFLSYFIHIIQRHWKICFQHELKLGLHVVLLDIGLNLLSPTDCTLIIISALSEISNRIVGKTYYYALFDIMHYFFLLVWSLQILLFSLRDNLVGRRSWPYGVPTVRSRTMGLYPNHFGVWAELDFESSLLVDPPPPPPFFNQY